jgi:hypothetical protein
VPWLFVVQVEQLFYPRPAKAEQQNPINMNDETA